jgi:hypothetical protein
MSSVSRYRQYAADCVRQAQNEDTPEDKTIMLNVALAWLRLARQTEAPEQPESPPTTPDIDQHELAT